MVPEFSFFFFQFQHHTLLHQQILITRDLSMVMMTMMIFFSLSAAFYTAGFKLNFLFHFKQKKMYESYHHNAMKWWFQMDEYAVRLFDYLWWLNHSKLWISSFYWIPIYYSGAFCFLKCLLFFFHNTFYRMKIMKIFSQHFFSIVILISTYLFCLL